MSGPQLILPALWSGTLWASGHSLPDFKDSLFWSSFFPQDVKCYVGHSPIQAFVCVLRGRGWGRDGKFDILVITYSSYSYRGGPLCHIISISTTPLRKWIKWRIGSLFEKLISLKQNIISYIFLFFFLPMNMTFTASSSKHYKIKNTSISNWDSCTWSMLYQVARSSQQNFQGWEASPDRWTMVTLPEYNSRNASKCKDFDQPFKCMCVWNGVCY